MRRQQEESQAATSLSTLLPVDLTGLTAYSPRSSGTQGGGPPHRYWIEGVAETLLSHDLNVIEASHRTSRCLHLPQDTEEQEEQEKEPNKLTPLYQQILQLIW